MKLLFAATAAKETMAAIDAIMDGDYAIMKACGQHGVMCGGKCKNKRFKGTNRHKVFRRCCHSRMISTVDYGNADFAASFWMDAS